MKKSLLLLLLTPFLYNCAVNSPNSGTAGGSTTKRPTSAGRSYDGTTIEKVELTDRYTIMYVSHYNQNRAQRDNQGRVVRDGVSQIRIKPSARLIGLNGQRQFRFVKATGIPTDPQYINSRPGDKTNFVLYFERLDPGIEVFDLFECNDFDNMVCWNFYGIEVSNPAAKVQNAPVIDNIPNKNPGEVELPTAKPQVYTQEVLIRGVVRDSKTLKPISARIDFKLSPQNTMVDSIQSFPGSGEYKIRLQNNQVYNYTVRAAGYLVNQNNIDLTKVAQNQNITRDILLDPVVVGVKVTLNNIFFEVSKFDLLPASYAELDKLVGLMKDNPTMEIKIEGHTDIIGDKDANLQLSKDRATAVKNYIVSKGINAYRIEAIGYGATKPIVAKGTDEERKVNRRVEFVVVKQ
jgi:OmpA-OmpF porin, OOP family